MGSNLHYPGLARKVSSLNIDLIDFNNVFVLYAFLVFCCATGSGAMDLYYRMVWSKIREGEKGEVRKCHLDIFM